MKPGVCAKTALCGITSSQPSPAEKWLTQRFTAIFCLKSFIKMFMILFNFSDSWLTKYLTICTLPDLSNTLEAFSSLLSKLRILCSYHDGSSDSVSGMMDAFFLHIFSCIKTLYSNGIMALQIADTAFGFTKFVFDNSFCVQKYDSFEDVLKFFTYSETANERLLYSQIF